MNVVLVSGTFPPRRCGVGDYTACLAGALIQKACRIRVVTGGGAAARADGVPAATVSATWARRDAASWLRALASCEPDVIHFQYPTAAYGRGGAATALLPLAAQRLPRARRVLTLHEYGVLRPWGRWRLRGMIRAADRVICTTEVDARLVRRDHPDRIGRIAVIPLGSNLEPPGAVQEREPLAAVPARLVHFGTVMPNKGWTHLLALLVRLRRRRPDVELLAVGELNPAGFGFHARVAAEIRKRDLADVVRFTGFLPPREARRRLRSGSGVALAPYADGVRLNRGSFIALLRLGLAVAATPPRVDVAPVVPGRDFAILPRDPIQGAAVVERLLDDPGHRTRLQDAARWAGETFAWNRIADHVRRIYAGTAS